MFASDRTFYFGSPGGPGGRVFVSLSNLDSDRSDPSFSVEGGAFMTPPVRGRVGAEIARWGAPPAARRSHRECSLRTPLRPGRGIIFLPRHRSSSTPVLKAHL